MTTGSRFARAARALLASVCLATWAMPAHADDVADEAELQFQLGADRYAAGDYSAALEHFLVSNRLVPNKNVLFNIGRTYEQLKKGPDAYRYYVLALDAEQDATARARIEQALARLAPSIAVLRVTTDPPGATIYLNRKDLGPRGNTPRALGLAAGTYKVIAELPGYEGAESEPIDLQVGTQKSVTLKLTAILGTLRVEGSPAGAAVRLDREDGPIVCTLPCAASVPPGRHSLFASKDGFQTGEQIVDVPVRDQTTARVALTPITGALVVNTDIRDALVTIDGQPSGFTPAVINVAVGPHEIQVSQSGFRPIVQKVDVTAQQETRLDLQLTQQDEVNAASRSSESVEDAPASVTIISSQELRAMGYPTIAEAVRGVRGIYLSDDRSYVTLGVRGFSRPGDYGNRILVLIDGHPANDDYIWSSYVGYDGRVDLEDVERIEIVRGPGSVVYGTGAFFGVINLVLRHRSEPTHGEAGLGAAEYGVGRARVAGVVRFGPDAGLWTSVSAAHGTGRDFFYPELVANPQDPNAELGANGLPIDGYARGVDGFDAATVQGRAWYRALTVQWFLTSRKKTLPTGEYGAIFGDPRNHFADTRGFLEARFEPRLSDKVQLLTRAHADAYNFDGFTAYTPPDGPSRDTFRGRWVGLEQRVVLTPITPLKLTFGGEVIRHVETSQRGVNDQGAYLSDDAGNAGRDDPFTVVAGYALADVTPHPRVKITAGARLDYYSSLTSFDALAAFSPRLAVILKPYERGNLKILFGKAFRAPSVYELYYTSPTQPRPVDLQPEQIYSGELEFTHRFSPTVTGTVAGYANYVKSLIELRTLSDAETTQYANSDALVLVLGGEGEVKREWRQGWMLGATYSYQNARYLDAPGLRDVPNSVTHLGSVKGAVPILGRTLMLMSRLTIEGPRPDGNYRAEDPPQLKTDPGVIWDLVFSGEVERLNMTYAIGAYNLTDWKYQSVPSGEFRQRTLIQNGRTALASVNVRF